MPYFNPSTSMGNNANMIPGNPLAGALAGIQTGMSLEAGKQDFQDSRLAFMANLHKYEQSQLDDPLNAAQREAGIADANVKTGWDQSGGARSVLQAGLDSSLATTAGNQEDTKKKQNEAAGEFMNRLSQEMDAHTNPSKNPGETTKWWEDKKKEAEQHKISWDGIVPTEEARTQMKAKAAAWTNSIAFQQKMAEQAAQAAAQHKFQTDPNFSGSTEGSVKVAKARAVADLENKTALENLKAGHLKDQAILKSQLASPATLEGLAVKHIKEGNTSELDTDLEALWLINIQKDPKAVIGHLGSDNFKKDWMARKEAELRKQAEGSKSQYDAVVSGAGAPISPSVVTPTAAPKDGDTKTYQGRTYKYDSKQPSERRWVGQ